MTIARFEVPDWIRSVLICDPTDIWGNVVGMGLAELAAVLSPTNRFDRRGDVVFWDSFEDGLGKWTAEISGANSAVEITSLNSRYGGLACKLTAHATAGDYAGISSAINLSQTTPIGLEYSFSQTLGNVYIELWLLYFTGTKKFYGKVRYNRTTATLQYLNSLDVWTNLSTTLNLYASSDIAHTWKLVVDPSTGKYVRLLIDSNAFDLSAYSLLSANDTTEPAILPNLYLTNNSTTLRSIRVDDIIITQNEPA